MLHALAKVGMTSKIAGEPHRAELCAAIAAK
jgi:hypothetical protein